MPSDQPLNSSAIGLLLIGTLILCALTGGIIYDWWGTKIMIADSNWQTARIRGNQTQDFSEMERLGSALKRKALVPSFIIALTFTIAFLVIGKRMASKYPTPPMIFYLATGFLPGYAIFYGWKRLYNPDHSSPPPESTPGDSTNHSVL